MTMTFDKHLLAPVAAVVGTLTLAGAAHADAAAAKAVVDAAKAQGIVGEQNDGLLGFVKPSSDAALNAAVAEINAGRRQLYAQAAAKNGVSAAAAGASAFNTVVQTRLKPGEYYQNASGAWVRK
jgi:uncharacterized protein YdbL (DUF1318 family)